MKIAERKDLEKNALEVRKDVVRMTGVARSGHLGSSLSVVDILTYLYWKVLKIRPEDPGWAERDRFVLSKGHACPALYAALANRGFFNRGELWNFRRLGSMLQGHPETSRTPGVDASSGSLGMGIGICNGIALALRLEGAGSRVFCILGDGEVQEGSVWESAMHTSSLGLGSVTAIVDMNGVQMDGSVVSIKNVTPLDRKFESFGWKAIHANGHDMEDIERAFLEVSSSPEDVPCVILAKTIFGKGFSLAEQGRLGSLTPLGRDMMEQALREMESASKTSSGEAIL